MSLYEYQLKEEFEESKRELKDQIKLIPFEKKLKFGCIVSWVLIVLFFTITNIGKQIVLVFGNLSFILLITIIVHRLYKDFLVCNKEGEDGDKEQKSFYVSNANERKDNYSEIVISDEQVEAPYYLLDSSAFFAIQEYTDKYKCPISDLVYGYIPLSESFAVLVNAMKTRRCYVTQNIFGEIERLESEGRLERGILEFIEDDLSIWNNTSKLPPIEKLVLSSDERKYKDKHLKLVWDAISLSSARNRDVYIVSSNKKIIDLAKANMVEVVDTFEIKEEE